MEEKLKAKTLTEKELLTKFQELEKNFLKEKGHLISINEIKEIDIVDLKTQNKALQEQKEILTNKVTDLERKIVSSSNMSDSEVKKELQNIINEEIEIKSVKTGVFSTEEAPVLKNDKSFLQKIQDLAIQGTSKIKAEFQTLKTKYNDLVEVLKSKDKEIENLKEKVRELQSVSSTKQKDFDFDKLTKEVSSTKEKTQTTDKSESSLSQKIDRSKLQERLEQIRESKTKENENSKSKSRGREGR